MEIIKYNQVFDDDNMLLIKEVIISEGVLIYPTDTLYGLGGNFYSSQVSQKIDLIKGRSQVPYSAAVTGIEMLRPLVAHIPDSFYPFYEKLLPGKFTFLFEVSPNLDPGLVKGSAKIGLRIPDMPGLLTLIEIMNMPWITTSVNRTGEPALNDPGEIIREFESGPSDQEVSLFIDAGSLSPSLGSTILDLTQMPIKCIRRGDDHQKLIDIGLPISY
jgi:L-threonylcarbamoyladenylate synthase